MTRITVSKPVLQWAIERSGNVEKIKKKYPKLSEWLHGESKPTLRQIEALAKDTATPLGYFFLSEPPDDRLSIPFFRTLGDKPIQRPSANLLETVRTMERRQAWLREYLIEQGNDELSFVRSAGMTEKPEQIAARMKETLKLDENWASKQPHWDAALRLLRRKIEEIGIVVVVNSVVGNNNHRKLDPGEFRGFVLVDEYAPFIFVNGADGKAAQMFTLAHELAHIWLGSSAVFDLRELQPAEDEIEQLCNKIAAEFLVPAEKLLEFWPSIKQDLEPYQKIARQFKVSEIVAARRALDLRLITKEEFFKFYHAYQERERRAASEDAGGDYYTLQNLRIGRRFAVALIHAAKEGRLPYREAYRLTGLYGDTFERFADYLLSGGHR